MKLGVVFPQTEIGPDPAAVREYALAAEELGYDDILAYDHVLGANAASRPGWDGAYQHTDMFHEVFVLFGYLAGLTSHIGLSVGVLVLPQRQTALVAKQAAAIDVLSGGRMRLGVGVGWNRVEFEALGEDFGNRGRRSEEQVRVLRELWTQELVTFDGRWHTITDAGLNPLPVQRPIPVWFGGGADQTLRRIARLGDGWIMPGDGVRPDEETTAALSRLHDYAQKEGRDPAKMGIEKVLFLNMGPEEQWADIVASWRDAGANRVSISTMNAGLTSPQAHIDAIGRFKKAVAGV